ncbi:MAG: 1-acyl-sn-glycerol-3-phosphate acyltransferase [Alistipes sp.]|nr:1-acyl-sn-glycerol-3-phosphate acyltransferase [Alistipes sp.]
MKKVRKPREHSLFLKAFRAYLQYVNSGLYFRKEHIIGLENVPADGTPVVVVSNHQNCLNDPLCVCLMLTDRRMNFLARANVFNNPIFNKALRAMGLLPAYRMSHEGYAAVAKNRSTLEAAGEALTNGETVMLYPEAGHQDKRWLGMFRVTYLKMAFDAAEKMNFEQDVMILPSCNHYSNYFHARTDMLIKFGEPISLKPYYEQYKLAPRETMTTINQIVREKIQEMMLHIDDLDHYDQIDFLRDNGYGRKYAIDHGYKFRYLPSRLISDQKLVTALQNAQKEHPEQMEQIYSDTARLIEGEKRLKIRDWLFIHNPGVEAPILRGLGLLALLPLFLVSIFPTLLLFVLPEIFLKKLIKDQMFVSSFNVGVSVFVTVPLCLIVPSILLWIFAGFWWALAYFVAFPAMFILAWNFMRMFLKFVGSCRFVARKNRKEIAELRTLRQSIFNRLDDLLK